MIERRNRRNDAESARRAEEQELKEWELVALQAVVDMSNDIGFLDNPSIRDYPDYCFDRVAELRDTILRAQGALPTDSKARPMLATMQTVAGELRQNYRNLHRPIGEPDLAVTSSPT